MNKIRAYLLGLFTLLILQKSASEGNGHFRNPIRFPYGGPFMGLFVAIAVPLDLENYEVFVSYNFEGNYVLPSNQTSFDYPPIIERGLNMARKIAYEAFEDKFKSHGYNGKPCMLRAVCEAAEHTFDSLGVFADIVHILLTPSTSISEMGLSDYENAEKYGKLHRHCKKYKKKCSFSILKAVSWIGNII